MRILSDGFCDAWAGRCLNVHPSLLPDFAGGMDLDVHGSVLAAGRTESGCERRRRRARAQRARSRARLPLSDALGIRERTPLSRALSPPLPPPQKARCTS